MFIFFTKEIYFLPWIYFIKFVFHSCPLLPVILFLAVYYGFQANQRKFYYPNTFRVVPFRNEPIDIVKIFGEISVP